MIIPTVLFVYSLTLPSLLHPSIIFNCFYTCFYSFVIALSVIHLTWFAHSTLTGPASRRWEVLGSLHVRAKFVATPLTFLCLGWLTKKLPWDSLVYGSSYLIYWLFLSLTYWAGWGAMLEEWPLLEPPYLRLIQRSTIAMHASLATSASAHIASARPTCK